MRYLHVWLGVAAMLASGCAADGMVEPVLGEGKTDFSDSVAQLGALEWNGARNGAFTKELEFHAYTFAATAGATLNLEITELGSDAGLDTTLFVFGPQRGSGASGDLLASDDDSGFAGMSKLGGLHLEAEGVYTAVIGTKGGVGMGDYRIALDCEDANCASTSSPVASWPNHIRNFAMAVIDLECDTTNFVYDFFDEGVEEDRDLAGDLVETRYSAELSVGAAFAGDAYIVIVEPEDDDPELVDLACPPAL